MAISEAELQSLIERSANPENPVLSVYVNVDQSRAANRNRGYLRSLKDLLRAREQRLTDEKQRKDFNAAAARVLDVVSTHEVHGRALVLFSNASGDFFWQREVYIPIESTVRWEDKLYLRPLIEAMHEYERYGVVLVDREKGRVFTAHLGRIEEHRDVFSPEQPKNFKAVSKDTMRSQPGLQRREDGHALSHLKGVAAELEHLATRHNFDRLILAGPRDITNELHGILPKKLQTLVVRAIALPIDAGEQEVLKATMHVEEEVERDRTVDLVERLITAGSKNSHGALGLQPVLKAMRLGGILRLVYPQDLTVEGSQCTKCQSLFAGKPAVCGYCGGSLRPLQDIIARLADLVFYSGGQAKSVRGPAADRLGGTCGIGAFLRF